MKTIIEKMTYLSEVNEELNNKFRNLDDKIEWKDIKGNNQLKHLKEDGCELQNALISIYNLMVAQQTKINRLEHDFQIMFQRINNPNEEFSDEEIFVS
ncbi:hypothetical protein [Desulfitobacterium sp. PCE1]|uniref:hypothetical protein n=1 Tax=Desulfitobacterium sp. PCE1 TaxID=146907 RepID=UPI000365D441|nr:hypothetical protein [Desulfitobacterium sp. PCE1]